MRSKFRTGPRVGAQQFDRERLWLTWWFAVFAVATAIAVTSAKSAEGAPAAGGTPAPVPERPIAPATEIFRDDFQGDALARHWRAAAAGAELVQVADGALRFSTPGRGDAPTDSSGRIRLKDPLPDGDWAVAANVRLSLGTGAELFDLIVEDDRAHWIGLRIRSVPNKYSGHRLMLGIVESDQGRLRRREAPLVEIACNVCGAAWSWSGFSRQLVDERNLELRLEKRGSDFVASAQLGTGSEARRVEVGPLRSRIDARALAFEFAQSRQPDVRSTLR